MLRTVKAVLAAIATVALATAPRAAHDIETAAIDSGPYELIVIETEGCIYCQIFRRDVLPAYRSSQRAREVPMRFVDLNEPEAGKLGLAEPIELVPTVVLMHNRKEAGRIAGYVGPEAFFHSVSRLMSSVN